MSRLPDHSNQQIKLRDGRSLGYAEFGAREGKPIFFFNSTASRLFFPVDGSVAESLHARIITVERPGLGLSDFKPKRTLLDWPDDVLELADALGLSRFAVAGGSAGGPYAIYRQGPKSTVADMQVLTRSWGFDPALIKVKTYLWQGEQDVNVPLNMGRFLAHVIPNCEARFIPDEGHLTYMNRWQEIVSRLVETED